MKKLITFMIAIVLVSYMVIPACAVTPTFKAPKLPDTSNIKFNVKVELPQSTFDKWFAEHPISIKLDPVRVNAIKLR